MTFQVSTELRSKRKHLMRVGESRMDYLKRAKSNLKTAEAELLASDPLYGRCHRSFLVRDAMELVQSWFPDIGTFGVEHVSAGQNKRSPAIDYLNTGDLYDLTLVRTNDRYRIACVGDMIERGNYQ